MGDFILETRPQRLQLPPVECPEGFVAEVRPSSRRRVISETPQKCQPIPDSTCLKSFDDPNQNFNSNYETDVNDLLQNKLFSKESISNTLHISVIKLINTFLKGYGVMEIQGHINVSLAESPHTIFVNLAEDYNHFKRSNRFSKIQHFLEEGLQFKDMSGSRVPSQSPPFGRMATFEKDSQKIIQHIPCKETNNSRYSSKPLLTDKLDQPFLPTAGSELTNESSNAFNHSFRRMSESSDKSDNDEESGYASSGRESVCSPPRKTSVESIGLLGKLIIEDTEQEETHMLDSLIVPSVDNEIKSDDKAQETSELEAVSVVEYDEYIDFDQKNRWNDHTVQDICSTTENQEVNAESNANKNQDIHSDVVGDVPMNLPGDCQVSVDTETTKEEVIKASGVNETTLLSCKKCPGTLLESVAYGKHMLEIHNLHSCSICVKDFSSKNNLKRHVRIHTGSRPYKCGQCEMSFARKDDLKGHTLKHNFNKPFRCSLCKKGYTDRACVKNHMSKEHCSRLMRICPQCGESFDREEAFREHKQTHESLKQFACDTCQFIGTNHLMAMKHTLLHTHKLFSCKPCNAYFSDPFDYTKHVRKHKKNKDYSCYVCCFCNCTLPTYEQFVRHEYSHAQGKLHECSVCKKQFKSKASMIEHAWVHSDSSTTTNPQVANSDTHIQMDKTIKDISSGTPMIRTEEKTIGSPPSPPPKVTEQTSQTSRTFEEQIYQPRTEIPSSEPTRDQNTIKMSDQCEGQLLDLSMKPSKSNIENHAEAQSVVTDQTEQTHVAGFSSITSSSMSNSLPRNGSAIDARIVELETPFRGACLVNGQTDSCAKDEEFQIVWQSPSYPLVENKTKQALESENLQNVNTAKQASVLSRQKSPKLHADGQNIVNTDYTNRYKPYFKMVDLASKFIAARGDLLTHNLLKDIGNTPAPLMTQNRGVSLTKTFLQIGSKGKVFLSDLSEKLKEEHESTKEPALPPSSNIMIGLTGKLCPAPTGKITPDMKQEILDKYRRPQSSLQTSATNVPSENVSSGNNIQQIQDTYSNRSMSNTNSKDTTTTNSNSDNVCSSGSAHECDICNTTFESFFHLESHSGVNHNRYLCEFCGKGFTARPNRDRHVRYHTGERPYKCELCPSAFFRGDDLKYHRTTRHPMEQISCNRCTASFTWQKDLERHLRHSKCVAMA